MSIEITTSSGSPAFKFHDVGDKITGTILSADAKYETEFGADKPFADDPSDPEVKRFRNGNPRPLWIITVSTDLRDPEVEDDDGTRTVWANWAAIKAIQTACREAAVTSFGEGCKLTLAFTGTEDFGLGNPGKVFTAKVKAPEPKPSSIDIDDDLDAF